MNIEAKPEVVLAILKERGNSDPFIREIIRGAILEAALLEHEETDPDSKTEDAG